MNPRTHPTNTDTTDPADPADPAELGRRYATAVHKILDLTDTIAYTTRLASRTDALGRRRLDPTLQHILTAKQTAADTRLNNLAVLVDRLTSLPESQAPAALTALHEELECRLTRRLHQAVTRLNHTADPAPHTCAKHPNPHLDQPSADDATSTAKALLASGTLAELAEDQATTLVNAYDDTSPTIHEHDADLADPQTHRHHLAYLMIATHNVTWFNQLGHCIQHLTPTQARTVLADTDRHVRERLQTRAHETRHSIQTDPNLPCGDGCPVATQPETLLLRT